MVDIKKILSIIVLVFVVISFVFHVSLEYRILNFNKKTKVHPGFYIISFAYLIILSFDSYLIWYYDDEENKDNDITKSLSNIVYWLILFLFLYSFVEFGVLKKLRKLYDEKYIIPECKKRKLSSIAKDFITKNSTTNECTIEMNTILKKFADNILGAEMEGNMKHLAKKKRFRGPSITEGYNKLLCKFKNEKWGDWGFCDNVGDIGSVWIDGTIQSVISYFLFTSLVVSIILGGITLS